MKRVTSRLFVFLVGRDIRLFFRRVGLHVISQFCVRNREASGGGMVASSGKFPVKPEGTDVRRILIAHAMRYKSGVRNGHKILRESTTGAAKSEGVFADRSLRFKPNILWDNRIAHNGPPFPPGNSA